MENNNKDNKTGMESFQNNYGDTIYKDQKGITHYFFRRSKVIDETILYGMNTDGVLPQDRNYDPNDIDFTTTSDEDEAQMGQLPYNANLDFESTSEDSSESEEH